ncbi:hypothetical protein [Noviherbaspirillum aerium]|uniref:hypothetical protein n=1 Tax=Noviherbaspirillum aerium TaxID=2588497 RepID=UPI00124EF744|nr:hypothetical protein [Noviherbaspirillum aerium]
MTNAPILHDPTLFSVWAEVDPKNLRDAAQHLGDVMPLPLPQIYQLVKQAASQGRKVQLTSTRPYRDALKLTGELPNGFIEGTAVVAEETADPIVSAWCVKHHCYFSHGCSVCEGDYL